MDMKQHLLRMLVVEDSVEIRRMILDSLTGHERQSVGTGQEGLHYFKQENPDITFLDIGLPDCNGIDLLKEMRNHRPDAFIIMLTASNVSLDVERAHDSGANGYIIKPFSRKKILDCIQAYQTYMQELANKSQEEKAALFSVDTDFVPLIPEAEEDDGVLPDTPLLALLRQWSLLFVDDNKKNCEKAQKNLGKLGCKVDVARDEATLMSTLKGQHYNMIFLDTQLPDTNGYDLCRTLRKQFKGNPEPLYIVGLVEKQEDVHSQLWRHAQMDSYVVKPVRFQALRNIIAQHAQVVLSNQSML